VIFSPWPVGGGGRLRYQSGGDWYPQLPTAAPRTAAIPRPQRPTNFRHSDKRADGDVGPFGRSYGAKPAALGELL